MPALRNAISNCHVVSVDIVLSSLRQRWKADTMCLRRTSGHPTAASAFRITSVTAWGWEIMITCDPSISVMVAPARWAMERTTSAPAAVSPVATTA